MVKLQQEFTAAQLTANLDLFTQEPFLYHAQSKRFRKIKKITIVGGAAVADLIVDVYYGSKLIAKSLYNVATGLTAGQAMGIPIVGSDSCPPDSKISMIVTDAGNTNPYNIAVEIS